MRPRAKSQLGEYIEEPPDGQVPEIKRLQVRESADNAVPDDSGLAGAVFAGTDKQARYPDFGIAGAESEGFDQPPCTFRERTVRVCVSDDPERVGLVKDCKGLGVRLFGDSQETDVAPFVKGFGPRYGRHAYWFVLDEIVFVYL